ncbi:unnamed protein product [Discosporangium mesarthrocarpum]
MRRTVILALVAMLPATHATTYDVSPSPEGLQDCLDKVEPGDTCYLLEGNHYASAITKTHGKESSRITITGSSNACIKGYSDAKKKDRTLQIAHDYYTVEDICFDGKHDDGGYYPATAVYTLAWDRKSTKNGVTSGVTGLQLYNLEIKNFYEECIHLKYFTTFTDMAGCKVYNCGIVNFSKGGDAKVGEGVYIGTAYSQWNDKKSPESDKDDTGEDVCRYNWIHENDFSTHGNECVDIKEGSRDNLIENNLCMNQRDKNSGGFGSRGNGNTFRYNSISDCLGAGIRLGGHQGYGVDNHVYHNNMEEINNGGILVKAKDQQGVVCGNTLDSENMIKGTMNQALRLTADQSCEDEDSTVGSIDGFKSIITSTKKRGRAAYGSSSVSQKTVITPEPTPAPTPAPTPDTEKAETVGGTDSPSSTPAPTPAPQDPEVVVPEGTCPGGAVKIESIDTPLKYCTSDGICTESTNPKNIKDGEIDTYWKTKESRVTLTYVFEDEEEIDGISMVFVDDDILKFNVVVTTKDDEEYTVLKNQESSGHGGKFELFEFSSREDIVSVSLISVDESSSSGVTRVAEMEVCKVAPSSNSALSLVETGLDEVTQSVCAPGKKEKLTPVSVLASGGLGGVEGITDGNFDTRWSTNNTANANVADNDFVRMIFKGEVKLSNVKIAFFDGHLAKQFVSIFVRGASGTRQVVHDSVAAQQTQQLQVFDIENDAVRDIFIVGHGNEVGSYSKFAEVEAHGC